MSFGDCMFTFLLVHTEVELLGEDGDEIISPKGWWVGLFPQRKGLCM